MTPRTTNFVHGAVAAAVALAMVAGPATALDSPDAGATACRAAIAKGYGKLVSTTGKTLASCHKLRNLGKNVVVNCNAYPADAANVDAKGKIATAAGKLADAITKSCVGQDELLRSDYYTSCPEPCATSLGLPNPMTTWDHVGDCLACVGPQMVANLYEANLGTPAPPLSKDDGKCHGAIAKGYQKYLDALVKGRQSCQSASDKAGVAELTTCSTSDPKSKGATALTKAAEGLDKSCAAATLGNLDSCSAVDLASLKSCLAASFGPAAASAFENSYELDPTICPTSVQTVIRAGCSNDLGLTPDPAKCVTGNPTGSTLSVGWTGIGHAIDVPDHYSISSGVACPGSEVGTCGDCTVTGISLADPQYAAFSRCKADPSTPCSPPFANNGACPSGGLCSYFLGAPLAVSAGGAFTCTLNSLFSDVSGTADPDDGSSVLNLDLRSIVHTGESQVQPCPLCVGDTTPQDGIKNGTCIGGSKDITTNPGWTCDVQAFDLSFAGDPAHNGVSLDCPPASSANISGSGLMITLPLTTGDSSLAFENSCDAPNGSRMCACGQCTGNTALPCRNNAECATFGAGTCTTNGGGAAASRKPNACSGFTCDAVPGQDDRGECGLATTLDKFCNGLLRANGRGVLSCIDDTSCDALDTACPGGDCGECDHYQLRSCFRNPILTSGVADTHNPVLAGTFCLPPTANVSINETTGSPGAGMVRVDAVVHRGY